jgi:hypothetical protein
VAHGVNLIGCQKAKIRAHVKLLGEANRGKRRSEGIYPDEHFSYRSESSKTTQTPLPDRAGLGLSSTELLQRLGTLLDASLNQLTLQIS